MRRTLAALAALALLVAANPATAGGTSADGDAATTGTLYKSSMMLRAIDSAFEAGALTFQETRALYQEQAAIRAVWIEVAADHGPARADARTAFMIGTAWGTLARLSFNKVRRVEIVTRIADNR